MPSPETQAQQQIYPAAQAQQTPSRASHVQQSPGFTPHTLQAPATPAEHSQRTTAQQCQSEVTYARHIVSPVTHTQHAPRHEAQIQQAILPATQPTNSAVQVIQASGTAAQAQLPPSRATQAHQLVLPGSNQPNPTEQAKQAHGPAAQAQQTIQPTTQPLNYAVPAQKPPSQGAQVQLAPGPAAHAQQVSGTRMNPLTCPIPYLQQYTVGIEKLRSVDYYFKLRVDFARKLKDDPGITHLNQILTGLLNTSGGIVEIHSLTKVKPKSGVLDKWKRDMKDNLKFIPQELRHTCVKFDDTAYPFRYCVKKSPKMITLNTNIYKRDMGANEYVVEAGAIRDVMTQTTDTMTPDPFAGRSSLTYNTVLNINEGDHIEFKNWKSVTSFNDTSHRDTYKCRLQDERLERTLLAMPNMSRGGYVVIGVREDTKMHENIIQGQVLSEQDEEDITNHITGILREDVHHNARIWGDGSTSPQRGRDWNIKFIPVTGGPPGQRRRVIVIALNHHPGGVCMRSPECYTVSDEGFIQSVTFEDWKLAIMASLEASQLRSLTQPTSEDKFKQNPGMENSKYESEKLSTKNKPSGTSGTLEMVASGTTDSQENLTPADHKSYHCVELNMPSDTDTDGTDSDSSYRGDNIRVEQSAKRKAERAYYFKTPTLSFTEHKKDWRGNLHQTSLDLGNNIEQLANSTLFELQCPMNLTPSKNTIKSSQPGSEQKVSKFLDYVQGTEEQKAFAIASSSWASFLESEIKKPKHHLFDLLEVKSTGEIEFWVVVGKEDQRSDQCLYAVRSAQITKRRLLFRQLGVISSTQVGSVKCHIYSLESGKEIMKSSPQHKFIVNAIQPNQLKLSIATLLLKKETRIKSIFGDELSITLTYSQMETILRSGLERFVFIEGPPGSGKTYLALYLCQQYDNHIYICTTEAFRNFLIHKGLKKSTVMIADGKTPLEWERVRKADCVVFDDYQNAWFTETFWRTVFRNVARNPQASLFLFGDSKYQHFEENKNSSKVVSFMAQYCEKKDIPWGKHVLSDIHRNTRKIAAFIQSSFDAHEHPDIHRIKCSRAEDGDDIEIQRLYDTLGGTVSNSLVEFVKKLVDPQKVIDNEPSSYEPRDVAILLDMSDSDVDKLRTIFTEQMPHIDVHDAGTFPVTGYTIDRITNFMGLDRKVIVLVVDEGVETSHAQTGHSLSNPRYRSFAASRGISRVVFVVESDLSTSLADTFGLDKPPDTDFTGLWHVEREIWVRDLCVITVSGRYIMMYLTFYGIRFMDLGGKPVKSLRIDHEGVDELSCFSSSRDGRRLVVAGQTTCDIGSSWLVYRVQSDTIQRLYTHTVQNATSVRSVGWTSDGKVLVLTKLLLYCFAPSGNRKHWKYDSGSESHLSLAVSTQHIYITNGRDITELSMDGAVLRVIPTPDIRPGALTAYISAARLFISASRDIYITRTDDLSLHKLCRAPTPVTTLWLHDDCYLAVGTESGLVMYYVDGEMTQAVLDTSIVTAITNHEPPESDLRGLWHVERDKWVRDLCVIDVSGWHVMIYLMDSGIRFMSLGGEPINSLHVDHQGIDEPSCLSSNRDGGHLVVAGQHRFDNDSLWFVYRVQSGKIKRIHTRRLQGIRSVQSVGWTCGGNVLVLTNPFLYCFSPSGDLENWRYVRGNEPQVSMAVSAKNIYISNGLDIMELTMEGATLRVIPTPGMRPGPLTLHTLAGRLFVAASRTIYIMKTDELSFSKLCQVHDPVTSLWLHEDRYLGVGTEKGLIMYYVYPSEMNTNLRSYNVTRLWRVERRMRITDLCVIVMDDQPLCASLTCAHPPISMVDLYGRSVCLPSDIRTLDKPFCISSSRDGRMVALAGQTSHGTACVLCVYKVQESGVECLRTHSLQAYGSIHAVGWTSGGDLLILTELTLDCLSPLAFHMLWSRKLDISPVSLAVSEQYIYISHELGITEMTMDGVLSHVVRKPDINPGHLAVDSSGTRLFVNDHGTKYIFLIRKDEEGLEKLLHVKKVVTSLWLHEDRYLIVGTRRGLCLYDFDTGSENPTLETTQM